MRNILLVLVWLGVMGGSMAASPDTRGTYALSYNGFIENSGQMAYQNDQPATDGLFKFQTPGVDVYLRKTGLTYVYSEMQVQTRGRKDLDFGAFETDGLIEPVMDVHRTDLDLVGANADAIIIKEGQQSYYLNYYLPHCPDGVTHVKSYSKIIYKEIYPNVDWVLYSYENGNGGSFIKYDFIVHPGGNVADIRMEYDGFHDICLSADGSMVLENSIGILREDAPVVYQSGKAEVIGSSFKMNGNTLYFDVESYEQDQTLIIDPTLSWSTYYGASGGDGITDLVTDKLYNVVVIGSTSETGIPIQNGHQSIYGGGTYDTFIAKFDSSGALIWASYYGGSGPDVSRGIGLDTKQDVLICGQTKSSNFPTYNAYQDTLGGVNGDSDVFLVKFSSNGIRKWATYFGGSGEEDAAISLVTDCDDNTYFTGVTGSIDFPVKNASPAGPVIGGDVFISKMDSVGNLLWSTYFGGTSGERSFDMDLDNCGNIAICGYTLSTDFPVTIDAIQDSLLGLRDAFVLKMTAEGDPLWSTYFGGTGEDYGSSIVFDDNGGVVVVGYTRSTDLQTVNAIQPSYGGGYFDAFLASFDNIGMLNWSTYFGGPDRDAFRSVDKNTKGDYFAVGYCDGSNFPLYDPYQGTNNGASDIVCLKFDQSGLPVWSTYFGGSASDFGDAICSDNLGNLYLTGRTYSSDFPLKNASFSTQAGSADGFLFKWNDTIISCPIVMSCEHKSICVGDSILIGGEYRYTSGCYFDTLISYMGCDSIVVSTLDVVSEFNTNVSRVICQGDSVLLAGDYQTIPGNYFDTLTAQGGCDSVILTNLTVLPNTSNTINASICDGDTYLAGGAHQSNSGTYYDTLVAVNGCDSVVTTQLTVHPVYVVTLSASVCQGQPYMSDTTLVDSLTTVYGCDSILIIDVTVLPVYNMSNPQSICPGDSLLLPGGIYAYASGMYRDTFQTINGCDSIIITQLTLRTINATPLQDASVCSGDSALIFGQYQSVAATYYDTTTSVHGCDSILSKELIILSNPNVSMSGLVSIYCTDNPSVTISGNPSGGVFSGPGVSGAQFSPGIAGEGTHTLTYNYTDNEGCSGTASRNVIITTCPGIENKEETAALFIYPNPATEKLMVEYKNSEPADFVIYNLTGQMVVQAKLNSNLTELPVADLPSGIYLYHVTGADGIRYTGKLAVQ